MHEEGCIRILFMLKYAYEVCCCVLPVKHSHESTDMYVVHVDVA